MMGSSAVSINNGWVTSEAGLLQGRAALPKRDKVEVRVIKRTCVEIVCGW